MLWYKLTQSIAVVFTHQSMALLCSVCTCNCRNSPRYKCTTCFLKFFKALKLTETIQKLFSNLCCHGNIDMICDHTSIYCDWSCKRK